MRITDKMRMNWLGKQPIQWFNDRCCWMRIGKLLPSIFSIRKAIDYAIKQETKSRALKGEKLKGGA